MNFGKPNECERLDTLAPVELALLAHVANVRLTTKDVWEHAPDLAGLPRSEVGAAVRELIHKKLLVPGFLYHGRHYFVLTSAAAQLLKVAIGVSGLLSEPVKLKAYARQQLVCTVRHDLKLLGSGVKQVFLPSLEVPMDGFAMRQTTDATVANIAFIRVDSSFAGRPSRSAQTIRNDILRFAKLPALAAHMQAQRFEYIWITMTSRRAEAVKTHFRKYHRVGNSPITIVVMPQLLPLVVSTAIGKEAFNQNKT